MTTQTPGTMCLSASIESCINRLALLLGTPPWWQASSGSFSQNGPGWVHTSVDGHHHVDDLQRDIATFAPC